MFITKFYGQRNKNSAYIYVVKSCGIEQGFLSYRFICLSIMLILSLMSVIRIHILHYGLHAHIIMYIHIVNIVKF